MFRDNGIIPSLKLLALFAVLAIPINLLSLFSFGWNSFFILNSILLLFSFIDLVLSPRRNEIKCTRILEEEVERRENFIIQYQINNNSNFPIRFELLDDIPSSFIHPIPIKEKIHGRKSIVVTNKTEAQIRGDYELKKIYFRYQTMLGFWKKQMVFEVYNKIRVIPDMSQIKGHYTKVQKILSSHGNKLKRYQVGSGEFAQVRSYVLGDDPRKINWQQTAKLSELMTNVYEPEHGKHITLLIDSGRAMGVELTDGNRLELAFEAALTVAAVALKLGDYVSVMVFSNQVKKYIPFGKGLPHLQTIIKEIYNIHSEPIDSNYMKAFNYLELKQKRRSLIILFSDLDPILFEQTPLQYIQRLKRIHLFLLMSIADPMIRQWIKKSPDDEKVAMIKSIAQKQILRKKDDTRRLSQVGIEMIEAPEEHLAVATLSHYIDVINRGVL